jgi:hypothetical protein
MQATGQNVLAYCKLINFEATFDSDVHTFVCDSRSAALLDCNTCERAAGDRRAGSIKSLRQTCLGDPPRNPLVLNDITGVEAPAPAKKTIDLEGRLVKDAVRKALQDRHKAPY